MAIANAFLCYYSLKLYSKFYEKLNSLSWRQNTLKDFKMLLQFSQNFYFKFKQMLSYTVNKECPWILIAMMVINVRSGNSLIEQQ